MGQEWRPKTYAEQDDWFREALARLVPIASEDGELAKRAGAAISQEFRGFARIGLVDDLVTAAKTIREKGFWSQGWKRLCMAMYFDRKDWPPEVQAKIDQLEQELRPETIEERFSTFVTNEPWGFYLPHPQSADEVEQDMASLAEKVGSEVAKLPDHWPSFVRRACVFEGQGSCNAFGRGLAQGAVNISEFWSMLVSIFSEQESEIRNPSILCGFLEISGESKPDEIQDWMDGAVDDETLGPHLVELSMSLPIDRRSIERLKDSIQIGKVPLWKYIYLKLGGVTKLIPPEALAEFLRTLSATGRDGAITAADILHMYFFGSRQDGQEIDPELLEFGRSLLRSPFMYQANSKSDAHDLAELAKACLNGAKNEAEVREICEQLLRVTELPYSSRPRMGELVRALAKLHPRILLEVALRNDETAQLIGRKVFGRTDDQREPNDRSSLSDNVRVIIDWVMEDPSQRTVRAARFVRYFEEEKKGKVSWSAVADELINLDDVGIDVLNVFYSRFHSGTSWGPRSSRYVRRRPLLKVLTSHVDPSIREWAGDTLEKLDQEIARLNDEEHTRDERFE